MLNMSHEKGTLSQDITANFFCMFLVTGVDIALWSGIEINVAIICGSVPALRAFVNRIILGVSHGTSSNYVHTSQSRSGTSNPVLQSTMDDNLEEKRKEGIIVDRMFEMKSYNAGDLTTIDRTIHFSWKTPR